MWVLSCISERTHRLPFDIKIVLIENCESPNGCILTEKKLENEFFFGFLNVLPYINMVSGKNSRASRLQWQGILTHSSSAWNHQQLFDKEFINASRKHLQAALLYQTYFFHTICVPTQVTSNLAKLSQNMVCPSECAPQLMSQQIPRFHFSHTKNPWCWAGSACIINCALSQDGGNEFLGFRP